MHVQFPARSPAPAGAASMSPEQEGKDKNKPGDGSDFQGPLTRSKRERTLPGSLDKKRKGADKNGGDQKRQKQDASTQTVAPVPRSPKALIINIGRAFDRYYNLDMCDGNLIVRALGWPPITLRKHTILHTWTSGAVRRADLKTLSLHASPGTVHRCDCQAHMDRGRKVPFTFVTGEERACLVNDKWEAPEKTQAIRTILKLSPRGGGRTGSSCTIMP